MTEVVESYGSVARGEGEEITPIIQDQKEEIYNEDEDADLMDAKRPGQLCGSFRNVAGVIIVLLLCSNDIGQSEYAQVG
jgi:hypothetical protein